MNTMKQRPRCYSFKPHTNPRRYTKTTQQISKRNITERKKRKTSKSSLKTNTFSSEGILEVIKCISKATQLPSGSISLPNTFQIIKKDYQKSMSSFDSVIDLTQSETDLFATTGIDRGSSSTGDNNISSKSKAILTIYPPKPLNLFSCPSDELCVFSQDFYEKLSRKKSRSTSHLNSSDLQVRSKRSTSIETDSESFDDVWKLKRTFPIGNFNKIENYIDLTTDEVKKENDGTSNLDEDMKSLKVSQYE
nr:uncharacterized protein LOC111424400 [Onthophagus taurus]